MSTEIEVIRQLHPLDRERYRFAVRADTNTINVHLIGYRAERRQSTRHKSWIPYRVWSANQYYSKSFACENLEQPPDVPLSVERDLFTTFNRFIRKHFTVVPT